MSLHTKCLGCDDLPLDLETILKSLFRKDSEGNIYLPLKFNVCSSRDALAAECGSDYTAEQLFRAALVIDDCGHCALKVGIDEGSLDLICDECEEPLL